MSSVASHWQVFASLLCAWPDKAEAGLLSRSRESWDGDCAVTGLREGQGPGEGVQEAMMPELAYCPQCWAL